MNLKKGTNQQMVITISSTANNLVYEWKAFNATTANKIQRNMSAILSAWQIGHSAAQCREREEIPDSSAPTRDGGWVKVEHILHNNRIESGNDFILRT